MWFALLVPAAQDAAPQALVSGGLFVWLALLLGLLVGTCAAALWVLVSRSRQWSESVQRLEILERIHGNLGKLAGERGDIDLRRLEHVLLDIRDGLRSLEDAVLQVLQTPRGEAGDVVVPAGAPDLGERIVNRLLAMGYTQIEVVGGREVAAAAAATGEGEVPVEARRSGVLHKGRVLVRDGRIQDVSMSPAYGVFP